MNINDLLLSIYVEEELLEYVALRVGGGGGRVETYLGLPTFRKKNFYPTSGRPNCL
jgi:hypothetical protein